MENLFRDPAAPHAREPALSISMEEIERLSKGGRAVRDVFGTPFSVRVHTYGKSFMPAYIVEHAWVKAALPYLGHSAYFALASGFLMTDILTLRCLLVGGYTGLVAFHSFHPRPLRIPLRWSAFFVAVNVYMVYDLLSERYPTGLTDEDQKLHREFYADKMSPRQFVWLLNLGERRTLKKGDRLTTEREECTLLYFVESGGANLWLHGEHVATISRGGFVNDVAFQQGAGSAAYGTVMASSDELHVIIWEMGKLRDALDGMPAMATCFNHVLVRSLVEQLLQRYRLANQLKLEAKAAAQIVQKPTGTEQPLQRTTTANAASASASSSANGAGGGGAAPPAKPESFDAVKKTLGKDHTLSGERKKLKQRLTESHAQTDQLKQRLTEVEFKSGLEGVRSRQSDLRRRESQPKGADG